MNRNLQHRILWDGNLTNEAKVAVFFVESKGPGKHQITRDEFRIALSRATDRKIASALKLAVSLGWLSRGTGGWGQPDVFEFIDLSSSVEIDTTVPPSSRVEIDTTVSPTVVSKSTSLGPPVVSKSTPIRAHANKGRREEIVVGSSSARAHAIGPLVEDLLLEPTWDHCRNSFRDYFGARVEEGKQHGYLRTVQTWFQGHPGEPKGFGKLETRHQQHLLAACLNELLSESARDEMDYKSARGKVGNPMVLRTKVEVNISISKREWSVGRKKNGGSQLELPAGLSINPDDYPDD